MPRWTHKLAPAQRRFFALDGMRGLAAIAVALFHFELTLMPGGYLAVDFFFALSGFVLWRAYADRLSKGLSVAQFMRLRLVRLYPLFLAGIVFGFLFALQGTVRNSTGSMGLTEMGLGMALNTLMLPSPFSQVLYPINLPAWSLAYELVANFLLALFCFKLGRRNLAMLVTLAGICLFAFAHDHASLGGGDQWKDSLVAALRTAFSFSLGMFVGSGRTSSARPSNLLALLLFAILWVFLEYPAINTRLTFDFIFVFAVSPMLLTAGLLIEPLGLVRKLAAWLGEVSYAVYALHLPIAHSFQLVARKFHVTPLVVAPFYLVVALGVAWVCVRWIDVPMRRWLTAVMNRPAFAR